MPAKASIDSVVSIAHKQAGRALTGLARIGQRLPEHQRYRLFAIAVAALLIVDPSGDSGEPIDPVGAIGKQHLTVNISAQAKPATPTSLPAPLAVPAAEQHTPADSTPDQPLAAPPEPLKPPVTEIPAASFPGPGGELVDLSDLRNGVKMSSGPTPGSPRPTGADHRASASVAQSVIVPIPDDSNPDGTEIRLPASPTNEPLGSGSERPVAGPVTTADPLANNGADVDSDDTKGASDAVLPKFSTRPPLNVTTLYAIPDDMRDSSFLFYEQSGYQVQRLLYELDNVVFVSGPNAAEQIVESSDSAYLYTLAQHRLALAYQQTGSAAARDNSMQLANRRIPEIKDPAWHLIAMADRAATLARLGERQAAELAFDHARNAVEAIDDPVQKMVAATGLAERLYDAAADHHGAIQYDRATAISREFDANPGADEALRFLAFSEARYALGKRASLRLARMSRPYFKSVTSLTVSHLLIRQQQLATSQLARHHAQIAARAIESPTLYERVRDNLRIKPAQG